MRYLILAFSLLLSTTLFSQGTSCGDTIPVLSCPVDNVVCIDQLTDPVLIDTPSNLPDLEYFILDCNQIAPGEFGEPGPTIIGATSNDQFRPSDFGITDSTTLKLLPVAFDVETIQDLIDTIINNEFEGMPCCDFELINTICDGLVVANIDEGEDFTNLSQALTIFGLDTIPLTQTDLITLIDLLNILFTTPGVFPEECGGAGSVGQICYAYGVPCTYNVVVPEQSITFTPPQHMVSTIALADTITSSASVMQGDSVWYYYWKEVYLLPGFEVVQGGSFEVQRQGCADN